MADPILGQVGKKGNILHLLVLMLTDDGFLW